jgi:hypothetical protein
MDDERWVKVLLALAAEEPGRSRLCSLSARFVAVSGAAVTVMTGDRAGQTTVCCSDHIARVLDDLQFTLGEGPCVDAFSSDRPVSEPDLGQSSERWLAFTPAAISAGAAAVFGFPLRAGPTLLGALTLYRDRPGALGSEQHADALVVADVIAREIVARQAAAPAGMVADDLADDRSLRVVVHQATGMVAAQLDVEVQEALLRLRARAYSEDTSVTVVATAVVNRERRFVPEISRHRGGL